MYYRTYKTERIFALVGACICSRYDVIRNGSHDDFRRRKRLRRHLNARSKYLNARSEGSELLSPRGDQDITGAPIEDDSRRPQISSSTPTLSASTAAPSLINRPPPDNDAQAPPDIRALMSNQFPEINKTIVDELVTQPRNKLESATKVFSDETRNQIKKLAYNLYDWDEFLIPGSAIDQRSFNFDSCKPTPTQ
jgi:hypothetical protein